MKRPIFIMLVLVAIAFAGPMVLKKPDGTPFLESPWDLFSVDSKVPSSIGSGINSSQSFYKWQDENGTWHYSDQPQEGQNIETVTVNTNANLIQGLRVEKEEVIEGPTNEIDVQKDSASMPLPMTVPFEEVSKMLEDVSNLQQVMDDRKKAIDNATQSR
tara:strand:+ start:934 stop:1410 length:477 start_codon:yes stop_codon:yes gene_type:complete